MKTVEVVIPESRDGITHVVIIGPVSKRAYLFKSHNEASNRRRTRMTFMKMSQSEYDRFEDAALKWGKMLKQLSAMFPRAIAVDADAYYDKLRLTAVKVRQQIEFDLNS